MAEIACASIGIATARDAAPGLEHRAILLVSIVSFLFGGFTLLTYTVLWCSGIHRDEHAKLSLEDALALRADRWARRCRMLSCCCRREPGMEDPLTVVGAVLATAFEHAEHLNLTGTDVMAGLALVRAVQKSGERDALHLILRERAARRRRMQAVPTAVIAQAATTAAQLPGSVPVSASESKAVVSAPSQLCIDLPRNATMSTTLSPGTTASRRSIQPTPPSNALAIFKYRQRLSAFRSRRLAQHTAETVALDVEDAEQMRILAEAERFMAFAVSAYGWPMYAFSNPCTFCCKLPVLTCAYCVSDICEVQCGSALCCNALSNGAPPAPGRQDARVGGTCSGRAPATGGTLSAPVPTVAAADGATSSTGFLVARVGERAHLTVQEATDASNPLTRSHYLTQHGSGVNESCPGCLSCSCNTTALRRTLTTALAASGTLPPSGEAPSPSNVLLSGLAPVPTFHRSDLLHRSHANAFFNVPWYAAVDRAAGTLVIAARGTLSASDCITDAVAEPLCLADVAASDAALRAALPPNFDFSTAYVHSGMWRAAKEILRVCQKYNLLEMVNTSGASLPLDRCAFAATATGWPPHTGVGKEAAGTRTAKVQSLATPLLSQPASTEVAGGGALPVALGQNGMSSPSHAASPTRTSGTPLPEGAQCEGRNTHSAHDDSARYSAPDVRGVGAVEELSQTRGLRLVVCGHSLGAGVASLLSLLLRPYVPTLHCYAFSPPGAMVSGNLARMMEGWVTSVVLHKDCVPRMSLPTIHGLISEMINYSSRCRMSKPVLLGSVSRAQCHLSSGCCVGACCSCGMGSQLRTLHTLTASPHTESPSGTLTDASTQLASGDPPPAAYVWPDALSMNALLLPPGVPLPRTEFVEALETLHAAQLASLQTTSTFAGVLSSARLEVIVTDSQTSASDAAQPPAGAGTEASAGADNSDAVTAADVSTDVAEHAGDLSTMVQKDNHSLAVIDAHAREDGVPHLAAVSGAPISPGMLAASGVGDEADDWFDAMLRRATGTPTTALNLVTMTGARTPLPSGSGAAVAGMAAAPKASTHLCDGGVAAPLAETDAHHQREPRAPTTDANVRMVVAPGTWHSVMARRMWTQTAMFLPGRVLLLAKVDTTHQGVLLFVFYSLFRLICCAWCMVRGKARARRASLWLCGACATRQQVYEPRWARRRNFNRLLVSTDMLADHLPDKVQLALTQAMTDVKHGAMFGESDSARASDSE